MALQPTSASASAPFNDALSELVRQRARQIIAQAVETELSEFLAQYQDLKDAQGRQAVVRNGYLPQRTIVTGIGEVQVQVPKVRDRSGNRITFNSSLLPPYPHLTITRCPLGGGSQLYEFSRTFLPLTQFSLQTPYSVHR